jgi:amino acid adenylation domain-containing protein
MQGFINHPKLPPEQEAIRAKCFHSSGTFVEFTKEEVEQSIPERFERMVRLYPNQTAVKTRNHQLTYDELDRAANSVARAILSARTERPQPVALVLENDAPTIAGVFGALKAGKIFAAIDPSDAWERKSFLLEDSQANLIVTNNRNLSLAKSLAHNAIKIVNIDELDTLRAHTAPRICISPDDLAYILYTSGSTGKPKGVLSNHRKVLHHAMYYTNVFRVCKDDRLCLLSSYGSAQAAMITWSALLSGAGLYSLDLKEESLARLAEWLIDEEISVMHVIVTLFRHLISTLSGPERFPKLRVIRIGGSPASKRDVELFEKHFAPGCLLVNGLSSSETGIISQIFVNSNNPVIGTTVPVGYSADDKEILLLDEGGNEIGPNTVGEIAVRSRYLAPGYWRKPELTRAKFLSDPMQGDERIYLTGDLGRRFPDGCLEYIGRKDLRVKVRGYTIETAEVETTLRDHPAITEAAVVARDDQSGDKRLVAYLVLKRKPAPGVKELQRYLMEKLPSYMVPTSFVALDRLPLAPNGTKVDYDALPAPPLSSLEASTPFGPARTPTEENLTKIWADILTLDQVGIYASFFELGGHSLLAMQIIARINDTFHVEVPLRAFFESPTIEELAQLIEILCWSRDNSRTPDESHSRADETGEV